MKIIVFRFEKFVESFVFKNADGTDAQRHNFIIFLDRRWNWSLTSNLINRRFLNGHGV